MSKKVKRVLIVAQGLYGSGSEKFLKNIVEINYSNNIQTFVCSNENMSHLSEYFKNHNSQFMRTSFSDNGFIMTCTIFGKSFVMPYINYLFPLYNILNIIKVLILFRPNIVLSSNINPSSQFGLFCSPVPTIIFMHTLVDQHLNRSKSNFLKFFTFKSRRNKFVTVSNYSAEMIEKFWRISIKNQKIVPNGVTQQDRKVLSLQRENIILTVADFIEYKNPETWLAVAKKIIEKHPTYKFVWVGKEYLGDVFQEKIKKEHLSNCIQIVGYSANPQEYYQKSKLYFHPSLLESQGISILEAMSFGLPCIASKTGGIPESIIDNQTGFLCEGKSVDCFVNAIDTLIVDESCYKKMSIDSFDRIANNFSLKKNEQNILEMYQWVLASN